VALPTVDLPGTRAVPHRVLALPRAPVSTSRRLGRRIYADGCALLRRRQSSTEKVVEFFLERDAAEEMIDVVREDEPLLAEELRVEAIELG
jgi:hypothetical protein